MKQKLRLIATSLIVCFLFSCKESNDKENANVLATDSINDSSQEPELIANEADSQETPYADSVYNPAVEEFYSLAEVEKRLTKRASSFVIKTNRDTVIKSREGTLLAIPAGAFLNGSNKSPVEGDVTISVREFYKISDMMINGLTTKSNDHLLETAGMINIKVTSKKTKDSCILKPGKNIIIAMTSSNTSNSDGMQLFNGTHEHSVVNWSPRNGVAGLAQPWRYGGNNFSQAAFQLRAGFVFPDDLPKKKPALLNSNPEDLKTEIIVSLRDLMQQTGVITKKATAYVDTAGNLQCYKIGHIRQQITFPDMYHPSTYQKMKVNLPVEVAISYKSNLNRDYFDKLLKMGKSNPDSLITVTGTLNPTLKFISFEKIKSVYNYAETATDYRKKQKKCAQLLKEYEKRMRQLRLSNEEQLAKSEINDTLDLRSAQGYLLLNTPSLGWINCDRFYESGPKVDYLVKLKKDKASLLIVFNSIKSIISSDSYGVFQGVPLNEKITIVGLKTENGKLMMAMHNTTVTKEPFEKLRFEPVTMKEYKSRLEKLNNM